MEEWRRQHRRRGGPVAPRDLEAAEPARGIGRAESKSGIVVVKARRSGSFGLSAEAFVAA